MPFCLSMLISPQIFIPGRKLTGDIGMLYSFCPSLCLSVCPSVCSPSKYMCGRGDMDCLQTAGQCKSRPLIFKTYPYTGLPLRLKRLLVLVDQCELSVRVDLNFYQSTSRNFLLRHNVLTYEIAICLKMLKSPCFLAYMCSSKGFNHRSVIL